MNIRPHSLLHQWTDTNRDEMKCLLGLLILMGVVYKPRNKLYWATDPLLATPIFSQVMTRDRFLSLIRFLHFADNRNHYPQDPDRDRLYKIRKVANMIRQQCREVFSPGKNLSIDESLVLFKGRLSFLQYIKSKRARFCIKLFQLCTSNGIPLDFIIYHGNMAPSLVEMDEGSLITERIPATLMQNCMNKGHHLFIDNYYTSVSLVDYFIRNGTYITGTIRENRKNFPGELKQVVLSKGEAASTSTMTRLSQSTGV